MYLIKESKAHRTEEKNRKMLEFFKYDIAISFAGEMDQIHLPYVFCSI